MKHDPKVIVLAGPNGAGKSTVAPRVLTGAYGVTEYVNADTIARGLSGFDPDEAAFKAGRVMLDWMNELSAARTDFAFETTLAARSFAPWLNDLKAGGYRVHLLFFWLPSAEMAIRRVAARVKAGGHGIPEETIRRRYERGLKNLFELYLPLTDGWRVYDNSMFLRPVIIAAGFGGSVDRVFDEDVWRQVKGVRDGV